MTPRFAATVHTPELLYNFEYVLAGLFELERQRIVALDVEIDFGMPERGCNTARCIVREPASGKSKVVMFDTRDSAGAFMPKYWEGSDCYFKRSFERAVLERDVPPEHWHKFHPLGLFTAVRSRHEHGMWRFHAAELGYTWRNARLSGFRRLRCDLVHPMRERIRKIRARSSMPRVDELVVPAGGGKHAVALYQTRVFSPQPMEHPEFLSSKVLVNEQRAALIRRLRRELGERFIGGVVADDYAKRYFADVVTDRPTERGAYVALMQTARVVVYSEGLVGSAGCKLAEYLAAGRAIVMQRLPCELPEPLVDRRDVLIYDTPDECVAACKALLDDPARAKALGAAAQRYYEKWVDPAANVLRMLELAMR